MAMKRNVIGIGVSLLAFLTGYIFVPIPIVTNEIYTVHQIESKAVPIQVEVANEMESLEEIDDSFDEPTNFSCRLLETGSAFHSDDINVKNREKWLGLFNNNGRYSLRSTTVKVKSIPDELLHGPSSSQKGKLTGKSVSVENNVEPLFLVKNADRLRPGIVTTLFEGDRENWKNESAKPTYLDKNFHRSYEMSGKVYDLRVVKAKNKRGEPILALILEADGKRQLLHTFWTRGEGEYGEKNWLGSVGTLYWVGDLDRDNKPDFYLSLFAHMIVYEAFILLSSEAEKGKLVKKVALFSTSGCC